MTHGIKTVLIHVTLELVDACVGNDKVKWNRCPAGILMSAVGTVAHPRTANVMVDCVCHVLSSLRLVDHALMKCVDMRQWTAQKR